MEQLHHDRQPWLTPELKQQSVDLTAANGGVGEDLATQAFSDGGIGSVI